MSDVRLYVDEDASETAVVAGLRARNIDLLTTQEAGRLGATDAAQLAYATSLGRTIYTFNPVTSRGSIEKFSWAGVLIPASS